MIAAVIIGVLALAGLVYVLTPIGRDRRSVTETDVENEAEEQKRIALSGIIDLEDERDAGKLSQAEFDELRARYERDAAAALHRLEETSADSAEERLEREIASAREKLRCRTCGAPRGSAARCPSCGSSY